MPQSKDQYSSPGGVSTRNNTKQEEMVSSILKTLLESKELRSLIQSAVKEAIQVSLDKLSHIMEIHKGKIHELECQLERSSKELTALTSEHGNFKSDMEQVKCELNVLEKYSRRNFIRIFGIPENSDENTNLLIKNLALDKLAVELKETDLDRSHRIGKPNNKGCRAIIMKFTNYMAKSQVLRSRRKLKSTGIVIQEDLTPRNRALLKKVSDHPRVSSAWSIDGRIFGLVKASDGTDAKRRITGLSYLANLL
ncbi:hypothetical protein BSL78_08002 [Apostichopus japonicus]|uniref:Uncharacterized protein n=1 Tax=Stichopus japonicus TaxID=307972 RepID=A0A2G8L4C0_STIJA|nr:hypothetical protein BSL78_08002 [Apostichopus japonicus]